VSQAKNIRLCIVDDNTQMASFLRELLLEDTSIASIDLYASAEEFIRKFNDLSPDVVLMDIGLPGLSGIECIKKLKPQAPSTQFIAFTVFGDDQNVFDALRSGASGYILKSESHEKIKEAIHVVLAGGSPITASISRMVIEYFSNQGKSETTSELTNRECEILELMSNGQRYKEIANSLNISVDTVRTHIRNIYVKLEVDNKTKAINKFKS
jgi:two-component system, NarL family, response regulator LiaR